MLAGHGYGPAVMAIRFARSGLKDLAALGGLASLAPSALQRHAQDLADLALDRTLRLAVTGLRGGGKTVFITAIAHHLLRGRELPFLAAVQEEPPARREAAAAARRATCRRSRSSGRAPRSPPPSRTGRRRPSG